MDTYRPKRTPLRLAEEAIGFISGSIVFVLVTLAALTTLYLVVANAPSPKADAPGLWFIYDDGSRTLTVVTGPQGVKWTDIDLIGCPAARITVHGEERPWDSRSPELLSGGDSIRCAPGDSITLVFTQSNTLLYGPHEFR